VRVLAFWTLSKRLATGDSPRRARNRSVAGMTKLPWASGTSGISTVSLRRHNSGRPVSPIAKTHGSEACGGESTTISVAMIVLLSNGGGSRAGRLEHARRGDYRLLPDALMVAIATTLLATRSASR
jgi:hypothetical protein